MILYKDFITMQEYSFEDECYYGKLAGIDDSVLIKGQTMDEFQKNFHKAVDDYIENNTIKKSGKQKINSNILYARIPTELYAKITETASRSGKSVNRFIIDILEKSVQ